MSDPITATQIQGPVVLIVEDDALLSDLYDKKFQKEGFRTIIARDGAEGLNMAITKTPDFILLDMLMPKMNGMEMLEKLFSSPVGKSIPVIFLTNVAEKDEKEKAMSLGAKDYLAKAMHSPEDIVNKVKALMGMN